MQEVRHFTRKRECFTSMFELCSRKNSFGFKAKSQGAGESWLIKSESPKKLLHNNVSNIIHIFKLRRIKHKLKSY